MSISIELEEWQKTSFDTHKQLKDAQLSEDTLTQRLAHELSGESPGQKQRLVVTQLRQGLMLETTSFVGRIALGDLQVTICPKIKMLPLLHLLQYAYELRQLDLYDFTAFEVESFTFQDILIYQLERETRDLLTRGLHRTYTRREEFLSTPRGRISIQDLARQGGIVRAALPCVYYTRLENNLLNQVLLAGIRLGIRLTNSEALRTRLQNLAHFHLTEISPVKLTQHILKRARRDMSRLTSTYTSTITLIEMLAASEGISIAGDQTEMLLPGFLFDMNLFFQELIQRFLKEHLPEYQVFSQYEITNMLTYSENPRQKRPPELRPDYVVQQRGKVVAILDAKYRDLWEHDLPSHMLYQLIMYSLSHSGCNHATILYPTTYSQAKEARIEARISVQKPTSVILRPVDLFRLEKLVVNRGRTSNDGERTEFAQWLAFG